jgi:signal transduction histidine kinase
MIEADTAGVRKVFYHLIVNAIKYTPDSGSVRVWGRPLELEGVRPGRGWVEIVISDTGIGIDPSAQELIFAKFYQTGEVASHSSGISKFKGGGPGLGLAITRGIIEAHGGRVWAESPGHDEVHCPGSHFHVVLPLQPDTLLQESRP